MQWFRFYSDAVNDPKVQSLSGEQFKFWVNLLCVAAKSSGSIKLSDLPFILRTEQATIERLIGDLKAASLLVQCNQSSDHVAPYQWHKRQYKSDTSAERMKRHRDRMRDVTVTAPDTDTDTEKKKEANASSAAIKKIDFDFDLAKFTGITKRQYETWCEAFPAINVDAEIRKAAVWLTANPKNRKSNYSRFLVNWLTKTQDKAARVGSSSGITPLGVGG